MDCNIQSYFCLLQTVATAVNPGIITSRAPAHTATSSFSPATRAGRRSSLPVAPPANNTKTTVWKANNVIVHGTELVYPTIRKQCHDCETIFK